MTLKRALHCSAIIFEIIYIGDLWGETLGVPQRGVVSSEALNFISDIGEVSFVCGIKKPGEFGRFFTRLLVWYALFIRTCQKV